MNGATIIVMVITMFITVGIVLFMAFTRQGKNIYHQIFNSKRYVICHLKTASTDFIHDYRVVPEPTYLTKVRKGTYDLNPIYATLKWRGRLHFNLNENDVIPQYPGRTGSRDEILIQVKEVETALNSSAYDELFKRDRMTALMLAGIALLITILTSIYIIYELSQIKDVLIILMQESNRIQVK